MTDLDRLLAKLASAPLPARLDRVEANVLARIAADPARQLGLGFTAVAALASVVAGTMGVASTGMAETKTAPVVNLAPLGPNPPLAPSTLLAGL